MKYKYPRYFLVEVKSDPEKKKVKHPGSRREVSFISALGQIVTRMFYKAKYKYSIGFPETYADKVFRRLHRNILRKLNLVVFLVSDIGKVGEINWKNFDRENFLQK